jgi:shikimate dehydrogenase
VNTIWRTPTGWQGTNTDIIGFLHPLQQLGSDWSATTMVVLGGGGAARAVVAAGQELGCAQIVVVGRDRAKLAQFQASWAQPPAVAQWEELDGHLARAGLVVNCTPIGMTPNPEASPLSGAQISLLPPGAVVYDLIYSPRPTLLLQMAAQRGLGAIDGVEMLVYQGAAAWEYWLGRPAPAALMQQALLESLASK